MIVVRRWFPKVLLDNDEVFFSYLENSLSNVDELCSVEIEHHKDSYKVRIAPSAAVYTEPLIHQILEFHNLFQIKLELSKSIKTTGVISFSIPAFNVAE